MGALLSTTLWHNGKWEGGAFWYKGIIFFSYPISCKIILSNQFI